MNGGPAVLEFASTPRSGNHASRPGRSCEPKVADPATTRVRTANPGKGPEVLKATKGHFGPALKSDEIVLDEGREGTPEASRASGMSCVSDVAG